MVERASGNLAFTLEGELWMCDLGGGIIMNLGANFDPKNPSEYERLTLEALQTESGFFELFNTLRTGPQVQIAKNWNAWGTAESTSSGDIIFNLRRFQV